MAYITIQSLEAALTPQILIELTNEQYADSINEEVANRAIRSSCELIDGYLRARYPVPLSAAPTMIHDIAVDLTLHALYKRRPESPIPDAMIAAHKEAIRKLEDIRDNKIHLGIESDDKAQDEESRWRVKSTTKVDLSGY
ncbi:MAG: gp436 family protein [Wohlfahrtiimonas sp.]